MPVGECGPEGNPGAAGQALLVLSFKYRWFLRLPPLLFILKKEECMLVVDLGFSSAKWLCGDEKGIVRSCLRKSKSDVHGYPYRGDRYLVGETVLLETGSRYLGTVEQLADLYVSSARKA